MPFLQRRVGSSLRTSLTIVDIPMRPTRLPAYTIPYSRYTQGVIV